MSIDASYRARALPMVPLFTLAHSAASRGSHGLLSLGAGGPAGDFSYLSQAPPEGGFRPGPGVVAATAEPGFAPTAAGAFPGGTLFSVGSLGAGQGEGMLEAPAAGSLLSLDSDNLYRLTLTQARQGSDADRRSQLVSFGPASARASARANYEAPGAPSTAESPGRAARPRRRPRQGQGLGRRPGRPPGPPAGRPRRPGTTTTW